MLREVKHSSPLLNAFQLSAEITQEYPVKMEKQTGCMQHGQQTLCRATCCGPGRECPCERYPWAGAALGMSLHSVFLHFHNGAERWEAERWWRLFHSIAALFSSAQKIRRDGGAKIPALHQGKKKPDQQTLSSSAAALQMLSLGSVGKTHVKAESP